jgi:hypothetical protein
MALREAAIALVTVALVTTTAQAGLLSPADNALRADAVRHPETVADLAADCPGELEVGAAAVDISPYDPMSWAEPWEDSDGDGVYDAPDPLSGDPGEPYVDENNNGKFDALFMAGYGHDADDNEYYMAEEVHDPVWARALALTCGDTTLGMVSVDTVGLFSNVVDRVREQAPDSYDHVTVASTHTHASVDTMGLWGPNMFTDGKHPELLERYEDDIVRSLRQAETSQEPVAETYTATSQSRNLLEEAGSLQTDLRDPFVLDDRILATQFVAEDGDTITTIVNWSPHPETLAAEASEISSDYAHYLRQAIETEGATVGGDRAEPIGGTAVFFSGAVGGMMTTLDADPVTEDGRTLSDPSYEKAERIGEAAAWSVLDSLEDAEPTDIDELEVKARETTVPADNSFLLALNTIGVFDHPIAAGPAEIQPVGAPGVVAPSPFFRVEVNAFSLGAGGETELAVMTAPGEVLPEVVLGNPLDHESEATRENCWAYNPQKEAFNDDRGKRYNPDTGEFEKGFERQLAANPDQPKEPPVVQMADAEHVMFLGLANDELGYVVPADDFVYPTVAPSVYGEGSDRCGDDDHYEETVSASSYLAPAVANTLAGMIEPGFEPEPFSVQTAGPIASDGSAPDPDAWDPTETRGVWVDTSRSGGYEDKEDARVEVDLPSALSGCWGFLNGHDQPIGQQPSEDARGMWIDLDGDCEYSDGDGVVFADMWAMSEGQPRWNPG